MGPLELKTPEELKNLGNNELKQGNTQEAIDFYSQSLDQEKTEGVYTNRAVAYIKLFKWKEALFDCEQALVINPQFSKAHIRVSTCYTS